MPGAFAKPLKSAGEEEENGPNPQTHIGVREDPVPSRLGCGAGERDGPYPAMQAGPRARVVGLRERPASESLPSEGDALLESASRAPSLDPGVWGSGPFSPPVLKIQLKGLVAAVPAALPVGSSLSPQPRLPVTRGAFRCAEGERRARQVGGSPRTS